MTDWGSPLNFLLHIQLSETEYLWSEKEMLGYLRICPSPGVVFICTYDTFPKGMIEFCSEENESAQINVQCINAIIETCVPAGK